MTEQNKRTEGKDRGKKSVHDNNKDTTQSSDPSQLPPKPKAPGSACFTVKGRQWDLMKGKDSESRRGGFTEEA